MQQMHEAYQSRLYNVIQDVHRTSNYYNGVATPYFKIAHGVDSELLLYRVITEQHNSRLDRLVNMLTGGIADGTELQRNYEQHIREWDNEAGKALREYHGQTQDVAEYSQAMR